MRKKIAISNTATLKSQKKQPSFEKIENINPEDFNKYPQEDLFIRLLHCDYKKICKDPKHPLLSVKLDQWINLKCNILNVISKKKKCKKHLLYAFGTTKERKPHIYSILLKATTVELSKSQNEHKPFKLFQLLLEFPDFFQDSTELESISTQLFSETTPEHWENFFLAQHDTEEHTKYHIIKLLNNFHISNFIIDTLLFQKEGFDLERFEETSENDPFFYEAIVENIVYPLSDELEDIEDIEDLESQNEN
ncbi:hypothetical protein DID78_00060 [Candidatus Marinamargulisbacteria bacterium SCGC AG-343-D04]|nr:hypothetical protein DID78_00060 [Candidatus Marinamargulisbacteria bacterium SCGC AG-343-D04]